MAKFDDIINANKTIVTTDVKGKDYAEVNQRIKAFRMVYPNGSIENEIVSLSDGVVIIKSVIKNEDGVVIGVGHAYEKENSSFINKTSYIENCETSAVGRALGMCGFGIDTSVCSYEEVANAIKNQEEQPTKKPIRKPVKVDSVNYRDLLLKKIEELQLDINAFANAKGLNGKSTQADFEKAYRDLVNSEMELGFND